MSSHYVEHITDVKQQINMSELVQHYGFEISRGGYISCPFHHEKTASMKIYSDHYKCFGCGAHGDVISFVQNYLDTDFSTAMETLNNEFELNLPFEKQMTLQEIRAARLARNRAAAARKKQERIKAQKNKLESLWAYFDRLIIEHPVPDNDKIAEAYSMRGFIGFLIDNYNDEEGYPNAIV